MILDVLQGADGMERATKVKAVVFDKTGTLTIGKPAVVDVALFDPKACTSKRQGVGVRVHVPPNLSHTGLGYTSRGIC